MLELLFEIVLQVLVEVLLGPLLELLFRALGLLLGSAFTALEKEMRWLSPVVGAACGGLSLAFFPHSLLPSTGWKLANLIFTPLAAGGIMHALGSGRKRRGDEPLSSDHFLCGCLFTLGYLLVRQFAAK